jgi:glucose/arabinose dehydrogenase
MSRITRSLLALVLLALTAPAGAAAAPGFVKVGNFDQPIYVASPPDHGERVFVVEKGGVVREIKNGALRATPFLDISSDVGSSDEERGLLSIAFAPDYDTSGLFYVYMTAEDPLGELQVREYRRSLADPDVANPAGRIVWRQAHDEAANHNGGTLDFGPDGFLWFATGDGGGGNNQFGHARDLNSQLGKMLRIDPRPSGGLGYTVPADNPFGTAVWAYGLRNPFRFSFDHRGTRDLFIGDVGQSAREEIDWVRFANGLGRGADFGWSCREGNAAGPDPCDPSAAYIPPIFDYTRGSGSAAVNGGVVVRDPGLPSLVGRYLYADTYTGQVRSLVPAAPRALDDKPVGLPTRSPLVDFGEDGCGHVYVVSLTNSSGGQGQVDRIVDGGTGPCVQRPTPPPLPPLAPPGPGPTVPRLPDRTSPRVSIRVAGHGKVGRRATPRITLVATEACRVTVTARAARIKLKRVRGSLRAGRRTVVRLRTTRRGAKRLLRALHRHRRVTMVVSVVARDAAGNVGRVQRRLKIRRG